ncbi:MAG TPA: hypothetical protein VFT79_00920 [Solirubrobacterales bacterium]|nr:hypothetical protein [Solirubrobacterales bacterium]
MRWERDTTSRLRGCALAVLAIAALALAPAGCGSEADARLDDARAEYERVRQKIAVERSKGERGTREYKKASAVYLRLVRVRLALLRSGDVARYRELRPTYRAAQKRSRGLSRKTGRHHQTTWRLEDEQEALAREIKRLEG